MPRLSAVDPGANNILLHEPFIYFIRPSVNGRLGCFHGLTTASGAGDLRPEKEAAWVVPCLPGLLAQPETGVGALRCPPSRACCLRQLRTRRDNMPQGRAVVWSRHRLQGLAGAQPGTEGSLGGRRVSARGARGPTALLSEDPTHLLTFRCFSFLRVRTS